MKKTKRIALITWHGGAGGVSKIVSDIAIYLHENTAFNIEVLYAKEGGVFEQKLREKGVTVHIFKMRNGFDFCRAGILMWFLICRKYDIVHLHYITPLLKLVVAMATHNRHLMITEHSGISAYKKKKFWRIYRLINILTNWIGEKYTTVSDHSKADLVENHFFYKTTEISTIPNFIDSKVFNAKKESYHVNNGKSKIVGITKSLTKEHGIDHFVYMAEYLIALRKDVLFHIIGDGPEFNNLKSLVSKLKLEDAIFFLGEQGDIPGLLQNIDVLVLTSENETFGICILEAMAVGIPVVAYAVGGIPEVIDDGKTGKLIYGRNPQEMAVVIHELLSDEKKMSELGCCARLRVEKNYCVEQIMPQYLALYNQL